MLNFLYSVGFVVFILIVWFQTNAFSEYCKLFGLNFLLFGYDTTDSQLTFPQYLYSKRHVITKNKYIRFYIDLITCPLCLTFWICLIVAGLFHLFISVPLLYVTSLFSYLLFTKLLND